MVTSAAARALALRFFGALLAVALLATAPFQSAHAEGPPDLSGEASFVDGRGQLDRLELRVSGLPVPPADTVYAIWVSSDDGVLRERLGELPVDDTGVASFGWSQPAGESLLGQFSQVFITLGPPAAPASAVPAPGAVLQGRIDAGALTQVRRLLVRWPDSRYGTASLPGMRRLAEIARQQMDVLQEAAATGDVATAQRKAEHLVNLVEGQRGAAFGDHNRDGRAEDPGDGVGVLSYVWGALIQTQFAWAAAQDEAVAEQALELQPGLRFALDWAGFVRDTGLELAATSDQSRVRELAAHLDVALRRLTAAVDPALDPANDVALQQILEEHTLLPAYGRALALVRIPLLAPPSVAGVASVVSPADQSGSGG